MGRSMQSHRAPPGWVPETVEMLRNAINKNVSKAEDMVRSFHYRSQENINDLVDGTTVLMLASSSGYASIVKFLLMCEEIDINVKNTKNGSSALMYACNSGLNKYSMIATVKLLLKQAGIDVNVVNKTNGYTALMLAVQSQYVELVELLVKHPTTDINLKSKEGRTALAYALHLDTHSTVIVGLILQHPDVDKIVLDQADRVLLVAKEQELLEVEAQQQRDSDSLNTPKYAFQVELDLPKRRRTTHTTTTTNSTTNSNSTNSTAAKPTNNTVPRTTTGDEVSQVPSIKVEGSGVESTANTNKSTKRTRDN